MFNEVKSPAHVTEAFHITCYTQHMDKHNQLKKRKLSIKFREEKHEILL